MRALTCCGLACPRVAFMTAPTVYVNAQTAPIYGVEAGKSDERVSLPDTRFGFLTQGAFLATFAKEAETAPVQRGLFVREALLCQTVPPVPAFVVTSRSS